MAYNNPSWTSYLPWIFLFLFLTVLYFPSFSIQPYMDDFGALSDARVYGFDLLSYRGVFFRLWERLINALNYQIFDNQNYISISFNLAGLFISTLLIFKIVQVLWPSLPYFASLSSVFFAFHSINTASVFQIDTISQQYATVFLLASIYWFISRKEYGVKYYSVGGTLLLCTLLSKEVAVGAVALFPFFTSLVLWLGQRASRSFLLSHFRVMYLCIFIILTIYLVLRIVFDASILGGTNERYTYHFSLTNIFHNLALAIGSVVYMGSTLDLLVTKDWWRISISSLVTLLFIVPAAVGLFQAVKTDHILSLKRVPETRRSSHLVIPFILLLIASNFPAAFAGWVSELYSYLLVPFYSIVLIYFFLKGLFHISDGFLGAGNPFIRISVLCLFGIYALWMSFGIHDKLSYAAQASSRSENFRAQLVDWNSTRKDGPTTLILSGDLDYNGTPFRNYSFFIQDNWTLIYRCKVLLNKGSDSGYVSVSRQRRPDTLDDSNTVVAEVKHERIIFE